MLMLLLEAQIAPLWLIEAGGHSTEGYGIKGVFVSDLRSSFSSDLIV